MKPLFSNAPDAAAPKLPRDEVAGGAGALVPTSKASLRAKIAQLWSDNLYLRAALKRERIHVRNLTRLMGAKNAR